MQGPAIHPPQHTVLVLGARGPVGGEVARALLEAGARVHILTRSSSGLAHLPDAVERLVGDVRDRACLARAMNGVASAFYSSPHEEDAGTHEGVVGVCIDFNVLSAENGSAETD